MATIRLVRADSGADCVADLIIKVETFEGVTAGEYQHGFVPKGTNHIDHPLGLLGGEFGRITRRIGASSAVNASQIARLGCFPDNQEVGGQAVLGRQLQTATPWLTERHGYDPTCWACSVESSAGLRAGLALARQ